MRNNGLEGAGLYQELLGSHFLNNTFVMMRSLNQLSRKRDLDSVLIHLSRMFRYTQGGAEQVPLSEEIEFVRHYLEIQNYRFGERLDWRIDSPDSGYRKICRFSIFTEVSRIIEDIIEPEDEHGFILIKAGSDVVLEYGCGRDSR